MANKIKGEVSLTGPEGETYTMAFGFETLVLVEDRRKMSFGDVVEELDSGRLGALGALLWAGLRKHHPELTFEDAGQLAIACDGEELRSKVVEAITLGFPKKKEVDPSASRPQKEAAA